MATALPTVGRLRLVPVVLAMLVLTAVVPTAGAQNAQSQTVQVTASVDSFLTFTLCDLTAEFGSGLSAFGSAPQGTTDDVVATTQGLNAGEGVYYVWTPSCQAEGTGNFFTVESNTRFQLFLCGTANGGSNPDLTLADLRWGNELRTDYADVLSVGPNFPLCPDPPLHSTLFGNWSVPTFYYLRIDDGVADGSFAVSTTWEVVAA